ncbi:MAG TPA: hypothetical protein VNI20_03320 [Fimbriimonadaceae bacterium]|nr:hypothetical protein [Fimbriimonadaceae bacterium]
MIWLQAGVCLIVWIAYGFLLRRSSERLRQRMHSMRRGWRVLLGSVGLLVGLGVLVVGLSFVVSLGALTGGSLTTEGWVSVAIIGLVFVHIQVLGAAAMTSLVLEEVTAPTRGTSVSQEKK